MIARFTSVLLLFISLSAASAERVFQVSPEAVAGGNGSVEKPFLNLLEARDFIRIGRKNGKIPPGEAITVEIAPGIYPVENSIEFTAEDGGTAEAPVTYRSTKKAAAEVRGSITLAAADFRKIEDKATLSRLAESARGDVLVCDLGKYIPGELPPFPKAFRGAPVGPWLYVGGEPATLARWPNKGAENHGWATFSKVMDNGMAIPGSKDPTMQKDHPGAFIFDHPRVGKWNLEAGAWLLGYWTHDWYDENIRIGSYDSTKKIIRLAAPHQFGIMNGTWGAKERRFFAQNILSELDSPGEWFVDRAEKKLFYYPASPIAENELVLATYTGALLSLNGTKHLNLEGLALCYNHGSGITATNVEHVAIVGCVISNLAGTGITLSGSHNTVRSSDIFNIGCGGISVNGGDRKSLTNAENFIANNLIHHYALFQRTYAAGINVAGCGQIVRNNLIDHAPHNAILYNGNEHLIELNEIHHVVMETGDSGAIYTGRDWTSQGNVLRHNFIHDLGGDAVAGSHTMGIYLDDCDSGDALEGNVFYKAGCALMLGGGRDNAIRNNLVIDCTIGLHFDARGLSRKEWNDPKYPSWMLEKKALDLNYQRPPWSKKYPSLAKIMSDSPKEPLHNIICGNVFINPSETVLHLDKNSAAILPKLSVEDNLIIQNSGVKVKMTDTESNPSGFKVLADAPTDLGFVDTEKRDFSLKPNSWLLKNASGLKEIPFTLIGLRKDTWRNSLH